METAIATPYSLPDAWFSKGGDGTVCVCVRKPTYVRHPVPISDPPQRHAESYRHSEVPLSSTPEASREGKENQMKKAD